jgi:Mrp family chromosome partitioning ATPase
MRHCVHPTIRGCALSRLCYKAIERKLRGFMTVFIAMASQKSGVSKSTLAGLVAREYANAGWGIKIADLDVSQGTSFSWQGRRLQAGIEPVIRWSALGR